MLMSSPFKTGNKQILSKYLFFLMLHASLLMFVPNSCFLRLMGSLMEEISCGEETFFTFVLLLVTSNKISITIFH